MSKKLSLLSILALTAMAWAVAAKADDDSPLSRGKADLKSIGALEFGPDGVLFAGDSEGAAVYALDVGAPAAGNGSFSSIEDLDAKIAALLGTTARDVFVKDMAVHEPSGTVYLSIMRGGGDDARPVLIRIGRDGQVADVPLDDIPHARLAIPNAPAADAELYMWKSRTFTITDLEFIDGELFIAGLSNEEFASKLRRAPYPFRGDELAVTGLEIYHGAHGAYETFAPIFSFIPYEIAGERHLLAGYLCTPLVTFPLDQVRSRDKLRGKTIAEVGYGNIPTDLVPYRSRGEDYVLMINSSRGSMRLKASAIAAAQAGDGITSKAGPRTGIEDETVPIGNIVQAADYDADHVLLLGRSMDNGALVLRTAPKARL